MLRDRLTRKVNRVFTKVWTKLEGSTDSVKLLKPSITANEYEELLEINAGWFFEYSAFRKNFLLEIALDDMISPEILEATHVQIADDYYVIAQGDTTPPKGTDVTWKLYCEKFTRRGQYTDVY
jgi:hypothetical protein